MSSRTLINLQAFQAENKFADAVWEARGLNSSASELLAHMKSLFNDCTEKLIIQVQQGTTKRQLKQTLVMGLTTFDSGDYDTEEKEFIADRIYELAQLVEVDMKDELNTWSYGNALSALIEVFKSVKPQKAAPALTQECTKCKAVLETFILEKREAIPSACFMVAQCQACFELNLIEIPDGVARMHCGKYNALQRLNRRQCTSEQAKAKLEQLKNSKE
ncbi:DUF4844 domain-containing protein [Hymenobacter persicinus]|uniref:DUF4844 domain-containing protein n=1 Tax=Hymenobacter persicinus TaxID=2025506 RepID=A0A4V1ZB10_9BACT|nr:DUF4844 domain-containing protein [Hymenobacter persicinus]RYU81832.1 DUF4844 domain-containing protein [Hymenobacter persicinus]